MNTRLESHPSILIAHVVDLPEVGEILERVFSDPSDPRPDHKGVYSVGIVRPVRIVRDGTGTTEGQHTIYNRIVQIAHRIFPVDIVPVRTVDDNIVPLQDVRLAGIGQGLVLADGPGVKNLRQIGFFKRFFLKCNQRFGERQPLQLGAAIEQVPAQDRHRGRRQVQAHEGCAVHKGFLRDLRQRGGDGYAGQPV